MMPTSLKKKTTGKRLESLKFVGGSKFMKELQKTVFFAAYESVVFSSGKSVTDKEQKEMLRAIRN
jgi:predicted HAD superfamily phosphohydrolase